ncbi:peroxiredoxin [Candidatus Gracilibacteria bacterium]|nr:peroxiredoxin [Candidatus Gracilibacteria bacterium]
MNLQTKYETLGAIGSVRELNFEEILSFSPKTLLYFYPRDNTPGCTKEARDFSCLKNDFGKLGIQVVGVSKDSITSHQNFVEKQDLKIDLISDPELTLHKDFGAYGEKNNYGKIVMGVIRSTFLLDKEGNILKEYKNVRATGHAERVLKELS